MRLLTHVTKSFLNFKMSAFMAADDEEVVNDAAAFLCD